MITGVLLIFLTIHKKRDLSDNSKSGGVEDPKKLREESSGSCEADAENVFAEGLNDSSYRDILFNCLKKLEAKAVKIYKVANTTKESQINSEKQVEDLTSSVDYITKNFDEYEEERKKKDGQVKCFQERVSFLENKKW